MLQGQVDMATGRANPLLWLLLGSFTTEWFSSRKILSTSYEPWWLPRAVLARKRGLRTCPGGPGFISHFVSLNWVSALPFGLCVCVWSSQSSYIRCGNNVAREKTLWEGIWNVKGRKGGWNSIDVGLGRIHWIHPQGKALWLHYLNSVPGAHLPRNR